MLECQGLDLPVDLTKSRWWFSGSGVGCRILHFFFKNLTNFWLHWVFTAGHKLSPDQRELLSSCGMQVSHCGGLSCCRAEATREAWLGITPWLFLVSFHPTWIKTQHLPEAHRPSWFLSCPLLCPPTLLCISPLVFCPGQLSCWFSDAPSTSLPLWLQLALYLALACLTEISSSLSNQMFLSQRETLLAYCIWWRTFTTTTLLSLLTPLYFFMARATVSYLLSLPSPSTPWM